MIVDVHNHVKWVPCHGMACPEAADGIGSNVFIKAFKTESKGRSCKHESQFTVKFAVLIFSSERAYST
jgi:hypothetical protein